MPVAAGRRRRAVEIRRWRPHGIGAALVALIGAALPAPALAWSSEGHRIAAEIAERYLEPATAPQLRALLALDNAAGLADVATWADEIRRERPGTAAWHYVSIPIHPQHGPSGYDAARDCPGDNCVVAKIDEFARVLQDRTAPPIERLEALKFLTHLVADLHQPLDCTDHPERGDGDARVLFLGRITTVYALWDSGFLEAGALPDKREYATRLAQSIKPAELERWRRGTPADWATESYEIARGIFFTSYEPRELQVFYEAELLPAVNRQLEKAGVRLASLLNAALR